MATPLIYLLGNRAAWYTDPAVTAMLVAMSALLIWRHRQNIGKLLKGQESKIGAKG